MTRTRKSKRSKKTTKRAGCLSICILAVLILVIPCFFLYRCMSQGALESGPVISPADSIYHARLDTLLAHTERVNLEQTSIFIYDLTENCPVYAYQDSLELAPASCMKLVTALAAQHYLGLDYRFADSLFVTGPVEEGVLRGDLVLKTDYDPLITSVDSLILGIQDYGIEKIEGSVVFDFPQRDAIDYHPTWEPGDIRRGQLPIMLKGEERIRKDFLYLMHKAGIKETKGDRRGQAPQGAECIFDLGHTLEEILQPTLLYSSNVMAETIFGRTLEKSEGLATVYDWMSAQLDAPFFLNVEDGSGLSPRNSVSTPFLCAILRHLWNGEEDTWLMKCLPAAGSEEQRGTLMNRMSQNECSGRIWAKTGTLNSIGASSLAGYCKGLFDHWYAFAVINVDTPIAEGRLFQDAVCLEMVREDNGQQTTDNSQ